MSSENRNKKIESKDINSIFVKSSSELKSDKLKNSVAVTKLIGKTIEKQIEILSLNQMDHEELRTVVQL